MAQVNMGERTLIQTRLPQDLVELLDADARAAGSKRSQFIADLVAERYHRELPSKRFATKKRRAAENQEALTYEQAS